MGGFDWKRHLWWALFLSPLIMIWQFDNITKGCIRLFNKSKTYKKLAAKSQLKVQLKAMRVIFFGTTFIVSLFGLSTVWNHWSQGDFYVEELPYWMDKTLKYGLVSVSTTYILDVVYYRQYMLWYNWLHHSGSMFVFLCVYDYSFSFMVSRIYVYILGILFTARWVLHYASLYYYLGNEENTDVRIFLYLIGLIVHAIFTFGQLTVGLYFKVMQMNQPHWNYGRFIFWILFEIAVLPSQLHTFYDIYCIIRVKLYKDAFSSKMDRFSVADPIARNMSMMLRVKKTKLASLSEISDEEPELVEISDEEQGLSLPGVQQLNFNKVSSIYVDVELTDSDVHIMPFEGYGYSKRCDSDVTIDSDKVFLYGTIHQKKPLCGLFNGTIARITMEEALPEDNVNVEVNAVYNDEEYLVSLAISTTGVITGKNTVTFDEAEVTDSDVRYLELDNISYTCKPRRLATAWD